MLVRTLKRPLDHFPHCDHAVKDVAMCPHDKPRKRGWTKIDSLGLI